MELNGKVVDGLKDEQQEDTQSRKSSFSSTQQAKATKILEACKWKDMKTLRALAASEGGLLSDELRRQACKLLSIEATKLILKPFSGPLILGNAMELDDEKDDAEGLATWRSLPAHRDEDQVRLDVERSFIYYPNSKPHCHALEIF